MQWACSLLSSVACTVREHIAIYLLNGTIFERQLMNIKRVFWFSLFFFLRHLPFEEEFSEILSQMYMSIFLKCPSFLSDVNESLISSTDFQKIVLYFTKIWPVGVELFHADVWTDGQSDRHTVKLISDLCNLQTHLKYTALAGSRNPIPRFSVL